MKPVYLLLLTVLYTERFIYSLSAEAAPEHKPGPDCCKAVDVFFLLDFASLSLQIFDESANISLPISLTVWVFDFGILPDRLQHLVPGFFPVFSHLHSFVLLTWCQTNKQQITRSSNTMWVQHWGDVEQGGKVTEYTITTKQQLEVMQLMAVLSQQKNQK